MLLSALVTVVGALAAMALVGGVGLWLAGADELPGGGFGAVLAATLLMALGAPAQLGGDAAFVATTQGGIAAMPLSVTLVGALVTAYLFVRPLRRHAVVSGRLLSARVLALASCWTVAVLLLSTAARHSFTVSTGDPLLDELGGAFGAAPTVGFRVDPGPAVGFGLLWLAVVVLLALAASRRAPLPTALVRWHGTLRPTVHAVLSLLLVYVGLALVGGLVAAVAGNEPRETLAVVLLGLPNLAWLGFGVGLGASWHGHVTDSLGLPFPHPLAAVLRSGRDVTLDLGALAEQNGWAWLLLPLAALLVLAAGAAAALRTRPPLPLWRSAVQSAVVLALAVLSVGVVTRVSAVFGLSMLGMGGGGRTVLEPDLLTAVPIAAGWGALAGLLGALLARNRRAAATHPGTGPGPGSPPPPGPSPDPDPGPGSGSAPG
ncbi:MULTISPECIES: streptophobe family protein [Kitasatospora]|uniref:streptophobe family protein n=1 Tax=Kitasatospora TaxID=2063 RepID=UPI0003025CE0|nr:streptophobe family protein [Kitasatospora setae]